MEAGLHIISAYIGILFLWFVICLLAFSISVVIKKASLINSLASIAGVIYGILQVLIYLYLFFIAISNGFLWFLFMLFIGLTLFSILFNLLQLPFALIPAFFAVKIEEMNLGADSSNKEKSEQVGKESYHDIIEDAEVVLPIKELSDEKKYCSSCGEKISKSSNFCTSCGTSLKG